MRTLKHAACLLALSGLALPAAAQATRVSAVRLFELIADTDRAQASPYEFTIDDTSLPRLPFELGSDEMEHVAAGVRDEASPVARESLDAATEARVPFSAAPGGIVLGLAAVPADPERWQDARLSFDEPATLTLRANDGSAYALPALDRASLAIFLAFLAEGRSDTLIDIYGENLQLAPAFAGTALERRLERADRAPRLTIPGVGERKSLIVDRALSFRVPAGTQRIELDADLEIRFYGRQASWLLKDALHCTATWPFRYEGASLRPLEELPAATRLDVLEPPLRDVARIAGWLGFLRWAEQADPEGVAQLRVALQSGKVSASQR